MYCIAILPLCGNVIFLLNLFLVINSSCLTCLFLSHFLSNHSEPQLLNMMIKQGNDNYKMVNVSFAENVNLIVIEKMIRSIYFILITVKDQFE